MMCDPPIPIERRRYDAQRLIDEHPPVWSDPNKQIVFGI
jgi:hypothetical protein